MHNKITLLKTNSRIITSLWCALLVSTSSIAHAQTSPDFPQIPQLSPTNAAPVLNRMAQPNLNPNTETNSATTNQTIEATDSTITLVDNKQKLLSNARPPSYGSWSKSLMFPEKEIQYMKTILDEYEATGELPLALQDLPEVTEIVVEPTVEIVEYPSFHLKSILYHSPSYWSVWVNDIKITSRDNNSDESEIRVVNISKDIVRFAWKPTEPDFMREYNRQLGDLKAVAEDTVLPIINRVSRSARKSTISEDLSVLYFSLRLNESFSTETLYTFDGKPASLVYPSLATPYSVQTVTSTPEKATISSEVPGALAPDNLTDVPASPSKDNTDDILNQQSPKELIDSMKSNEALGAITPEQAQEALETLTPEQAKQAIEAITR